MLKTLEVDYKRQIIEHYIKSYNEFDVAGMTKNLHDSVVFENISNGKIDLTTKGIEEFRRQAELAKGYFVQREQEITSWDFKDSTVTINIDYQGILAVDLPIGMKVGDTLKLKGQSVFEFKEGQIIKIQDKS